MIAAIQHLLENGELEDALVKINAALESDMYNIELLVFKAKVERNTKRIDEALDTYNSLVNLLPAEAEFYAERGLTFHAAGLKQQALEDFSKAIELEPENGYRYSSRAFIKNNYGDSAGALEDYDKALELDPEDAISLNNKGMIEENMGRIDAAQMSFGEADRITGVDKKIKEALNKPVQPVEPAERKLSFKLFLKTLTALFSSKKERQNFFKFLKKK
jgi:tetratricopeptide (TPR) repeat protein